MTLALILSAFLNSGQVDAQYHCAAQIAYHEARGEASYAGRALPTTIAANRVLDSRFPNTMCGVMKQRNQFTFVSNGLHLMAPMEYDTWKKSQAIAKTVMETEVENNSVGLGGALYFQTLNTPKWSPRLREVGRIGNHKYFVDY